MSYYTKAKECFNLKAWYNASSICHLCFMEKHDFAQVPNELGAHPRRSTDNFIQEACHKGEKCFLVPVKY